MKHQLTAILTLLTIGIGAPVAQALGLTYDLQPNQPKQNGYQVKVKHTIDKHPKQYHFTVEITPKQLKLPSRYHAALSLHKFTTQGSSTTESVATLREVVCQSADRRLVCHFTVPIQATQNPDLGFSFSAPFTQLDGTEFRPPSATIGFFSLKSLVHQAAGV
jgi:predicted RND superfamily exporter protein